MASTIKAILLCFAFYLAAPVLVVLADMTGHGGLVKGIAISNDGKQVLTASFDYTLKLWNLDDHGEIASFDGHDGPVNDVAMLADGIHAASVGADGDLIIWRIADATIVHRQAAHGGRSMAVAATGDGAAILTGGWDGWLRLWNARTGEKNLEINTREPIVDIAIVSDDTIFVTAQRNGNIRLFRRSDGIQIAEYTAHDLGNTALSKSPDGRYLATIGIDNVLRVWVVDTQERVSAFLPNPDVKPLSVAISPDATRVIVGYLNGDIRLLDLKTGRTKQLIKTPAGPIWSLAFTPDGRFFLAASNDERVRMWHVGSGDQIGAAPEGDDQPTPWLASDHPGASLYRKCANCHALSEAERQRSGPHFKAIFGRKAGSLGGYRYSEALRSSDIVWTRETLADLFRRGPDKVFPGTKMPVQIIGDETALKNLLDYLEILAVARPTK